MTEQKVSFVPAIGREASIRGSEISLAEALNRIGYKGFRSQLSADDLLEGIGENPGLIEQWVSYCEDKRTSSGWYLLPETFEIGQLGDPSTVA